MTWINKYLEQNQKIIKKNANNVKTMCTSTLKPLLENGDASVRENVMEVLGRIQYIFGADFTQSFLMDVLP